VGQYLQFRISSAICRACAFSLSAGFSDWSGASVVERVGLAARRFARAPFGDLGTPTSEIPNLPMVRDGAPTLARK
jgi:hypothetical protein